MGQHVTACLALASWYVVCVCTDALSPHVPALIHVWRFLVACIFASILLIRLCGWPVRVCLLEPLSHVSSAIDAYFGVCLFIFSASVPFSSPPSSPFLTWVSKLAIRSLAQ